MITEELNAHGALSNIELGQLIALASIIGILIACLVAAFAWFGNSRKQEKQRPSNLGIYFCITLLLGFALYCIGSMPASGASHWKMFLGMWGVAPMALLHSISMFLLHSDISEVSEACHHSWIYMTVFSFVHTMAAYISATVIVRHFGFSLIAKLRSTMIARFGDSTDELFIFWGTDESSFQLSKDVKKNEQKSHRIVFVYDEDASEEDEEHAHGMHGKFFSLLKMRTVDMVHFREIGCLISQPSQCLPDLHIRVEDDKSIHILRDELKMRDLARLITKTRGTVHIFFLGNDETSNLRSITYLQHDTIIKGRAHKGLPVRLYARAETSYISKAIHDSNREPNIDIQLIDASEHSIYFMKDHPQYHPIRYVDIDTDKNPGTVNSLFHSVIIGFGWTGQEALRFLYEYGAFVDSRSTIDEDFNGVTSSGEKAHVYRSPFRCDIIDPCIEHQAEIFYADYPALRHADVNTQINLHRTNPESEFFTQFIDKNANTLNYVVVSTGKDDLNLDIAIRLFSYIRSVRRNMNKLNIFVQCASAERAFYFRSVLKHYNQEGETLVLFGTNEMIYTYARIVHNEFELRGRLYNESYCRVNRSPDNYWKERHEKLMRKGTLDALASLYRKEWEDCQNAYHAATKAYIYEKACPKVRPTEELIRLICGNGNECNFRRCVPYPTTDEVTAPEIDKPVCVMDHDTQRAGRLLSDEEELFMRNLARLEHLRWNASHEALGYISLDNYISTHGNDFSNDPYETRYTCNELRKCHNCIVGWEELDRESMSTWNEIVEHNGYRWLPDYKLADYGVVANALFHSYSAAHQTTTNQENSQAK